MNPKYYLCLSGMTLMLCSCEDSWFTPQETLIADTQQAITHKDIETASRKLELAKFLAKSDSDKRMVYNEAIVDVMAGNCITAQQRLESILNADNPNHWMSNIDFLPPDNTEITPEDLLIARTHQALAIALRCPATTPSPVPSNMQKSLDHMYQAFFYKLEVRDQISNLLLEAEPSCTTFISEQQKDLQNAPDNAIELQTNHTEAQSYVLCPPSGLWFKTQIRAHETLFGTVEMKPLARSRTLDDSMNLPYAQFHIDIFKPTSAGADLSQPIAAYVQPLPDHMPDSDAYQKLILNLPEISASESGEYLIHLYPEFLGEASFQLHLKSTADCRNIDDSATYTNDLKPIVYPLEQNSELQHFLLCPMRPDHFEIEIASSYYALISIGASEPNPSDDNNAIQIQLNYPNGQSLLQIPAETGQFPGDQSAFMIIRPQHIPSQTTTDYPPPVFVLIHNTDAEAANIQLTLGDHTLQTPIKYTLFRSDSSPCLPEAPSQTIPVNLDDIQNQQSIQLPPTWICPDTEHNYRPIISTPNTTLRVQTKSHFISADNLAKDDVILQSFMQLPDDDRAYLVENASPTDAPWETRNHIVSAFLQKPLTSDSLIRISTSKTAMGFSLTEFSLPDDNQQDKSNESNPDNKQKKEEKKTDKSKGKDSENQAPDKPSETKATPKGPGTDGKGDESTPDPSATGEKAPKYDPSAYEKDHINALLDALEQGDFYVPLSGSAESQTSDKDW